MRTGTSNLLKIRSTIVTILPRIWRRSVPAPVQLTMQLANVPLTCSSINKCWILVYSCNSKIVLYNGCRLCEHYKTEIVKIKNTACIFVVFSFRISKVTSQWSVKFKQTRVFAIEWKWNKKVNTYIFCNLYFDIICLMIIIIASCNPFIRILEGH